MGRNLASPARLEENNLVSGQIQYGSASSLTSAPTPPVRRRPRLADPGRFAGTTPRPLPLIVLGGAAMVVAALLVAMPRQVPGLPAATALGTAWLIMVLAMVLPSRRERAGAELARRLAEFRHALNTIGDEPTRAQLEGLLQFARALDLRDDEISPEVASIQASLTAIRLRDQLAATAAPVLPDGGPGSPDDPAHFSCAARLGRRRADQAGKLLLTSTALRFRGTREVAIAWADVEEVQRAGHDVIVICRPNRRPLRLSCESIDAAAEAAVMADHLRVLAATAASC